MTRVLYVFRQVNYERTRYERTSTKRTPAVTFDCNARVPVWRSNVKYQ